MNIAKAAMRTALVATIGLPVLAVAENSLLQQAQALFKPIPEAAPAMKDVSMTPAMVTLGKVLYFDPRLSESTHQYHTHVMFFQVKNDCLYTARKFNQLTRTLSEINVFNLGLSGGTRQNRHRVGTTV